MASSNLSPVHPHFFKKKKALPKTSPHLGKISKYACAGVWFLVTLSFHLHFPEPPNLFIFISGKSGCWWLQIKHFDLICVEGVTYVKAGSPDFQKGNTCLRQIYKIIKCWWFPDLQCWLATEISSRHLKVPKRKKKCEFHFFESVLGQGRMKRNQSRSFQNGI